MYSMFAGSIEEKH